MAILALFVPVLTVTPAVSVRANIDNASTAMVVTQLVRQFTIRNTVNSVQQSLQGQVSAVSGTNVLRAPPMGLPDSFFPAGVGTVPLGYNLPQFDGGGRMLGYCAWDNTASVGDSNYLAGASIANKKLFAVISPGLDGNLQTDCDHALVSSLAVGDDYMVVVAPPQASFSQFRSSVPTLAALSTTPGVAGDVRLVEENNQLYSYLAGTWQALKADEKFGDDPASGTGAISYTTGKVTVAEFQASAASIVGDLNVGGASVFTGSITANANLTVAGTTTLNGDAIVAGDLSIAGAFTAGALAGDGGALTNLNASAVTSGILSVARGGTGLDGSAAGPGALLIGNGSGFSVGNIVAGDGVSVTQSSGSITIENAGVTKFNGRSGVVNLNFDDVNAAVSGSMGVRLGVGALARNTTGSGNVALGALTLNFNYGGSQNVAIGHQAMTSHSPTGSTAVGYQAHYSGNGSFNAAFGRNTLLYPNGGSHNTAIGNEALTNTAAGYNVGLGSQAGLANTTGTFNTFLGYRSNISGIDQLTYATAIGANSLVGTSNTIVLGRTTDTTVIGATGTATNGILQNKILQVTGDVGITGN
ncbi:MAG TPA: hypothetical protein VFV43_10300, partial [Limnobacter sp.]|nr:hypothetical protein [Limnobacter sp.]